MSRATGTFQQRELRAKLLRLEQEIARARAAAQRTSQQVGERSSSGPTAAAGSESDEQEAGEPARAGSAGPRKTMAKD